MEVKLLFLPVNYSEFGISFEFKSISRTLVITTNSQNLLFVRRKIEGQTPNVQKQGEPMLATLYHLVNTQAGENGPAFSIRY